MLALTSELCAAVPSIASGYILFLIIILGYYDNKMSFFNRRFCRSWVLHFSFHHSLQTAFVANKHVNRIKTTVESRFSKRSNNWFNSIFSTAHIAWCRYIWAIVSAFALRWHSGWLAASHFHTFHYHALFCLNVFRREWVLNLHAANYIVCLVNRRFSFKKILFFYIFVSNLYYFCHVFMHYNSYDSNTFFLCLLKRRL